jgi:hypothetical protein
VMDRGQCHRLDLGFIASEDGMELSYLGQVVWSFKFEVLGESRHGGKG